MQRTFRVVGYVCATAALGAAVWAARPPLGLCHPPALLAVLAGALGWLLIDHRPGDLRRPSGVLDEPERTAERIVGWARIQRLEGPRGLERNRAEDALEALGLRLLANGATPLELSLTLRRAADERARHAAASAAAWRQLAEGLFHSGVTVSLVGIILALDAHPPQLAPDALAGALTAALYGLLLSQYAALPVAADRRREAARAAQLDELRIDGLVAIAEGVHPRALADRLQLDPDRPRPVRAA